jgi:hypothetical protein
MSENNKNSNFVLINKENPNLDDEGKFEKAIDKITHVPQYKASNHNGYLEKTEEEIPPYAGDLFEANIEKEINGIGMGVLNSGIPYLTQNGLSIMCGVEGHSIRKITVDWKNKKITPREKIIADILLKNGYTDNELYIPVKIGNQSMHYAYPESVCLAFLEYYAFHAVQTKDKKEIAR